MSETPLDRTECSWCNGTGGDIHPDPETGEPGHCRHCDGTGKATPEMCDKLSPEGDSPDRWSRLTDKLESAETELAAATKRAEEAENKFMAEFTLCERWMEKCRTAEQENARLRKALDMWRKGDVPGHPFGTLAEARTLTAALLNQPK